MKNALLLYFFLVLGIAAASQEKEKVAETAEQQLESLAETGAAVTDDDAYLQQLYHFKKHPLNLNTAETGELISLAVLNAWQVEQLLAYRKLLGKLINRYELQAIPGWDPATIRQLLPYISVTDDKTIAENMKERWHGGDQVLLLRYARMPEKSKGYAAPATPETNHYLGSPDKLLLRYTYRYKNLLQWGLLADKDAGEPFFRGSQQQGFDFYSFHVFVRQLGIVKSLALGDFTVNFGQGLVQWQSLAFKKNAAVMNIGRQATALRPYSAAGEYNFHRGAGITLQKRKWEATLFASYRRIGANVLVDSLTDDGIASSFLSSGYHRTAAENEDRNNLVQTAAGTNIKYQASRWHAAISTVGYHFSKPIQKSQAPYQRFALQGTSFFNSSLDYSFTWHNIHMFGEAAIDRNQHTAFLQGAIISLDAKASVSLLYRNISSRYQSVNANAFTENALPVNENGLYAALSLQPVSVLRLDAYADVFRFPWLKYRVDAASGGRDYLLQATYTPVKHVMLYARYRAETKILNQQENGLAMAGTGPVSRQTLRMHTSLQVNNQWLVRNRVELVWYNTEGQVPGQGFLCYMEGSYKPVFAKWRTAGRLQYFETTGYNERVYAYEADLPYNFSIPFFYGKGIRYFLNLDRTDISIGRHQRRPATLDIGIRWAQTIYPGKTATGSGLEETSGNHRSELKVQLILMR